MTDLRDPVRALAQIQAIVLQMRKAAEETDDPVRRNGYLRIADAIELQACRLDRRGP